MTIVMFVRRSWLISGFAALAWGLKVPVASAQTSGYAVKEPGPTAAGTASNLAAVIPDNSTAGPVRLARFSYIQGEVTWRADDTLDWSAASNNQPLKQGAQIAVENGGRAEIQLDDGGYLRLGNGAVGTLQLFFSDSEGEFTEIKLTSGLASLRLKHDRSVYQVDTPLVSVKADGPARIRVGISDGVEVGIREGAAVVEGARGKVTMKGGDYLDLRDQTSSYDFRDLPAGDSWERWNDERDQMLDAAEQSLERHQVPSDVAMVAGNLDAYGTWRTDASYGQVWCPRTPDASWRPYFAGHWVWVNPLGWTWCSDEPWGWAPYHYGAWFHAVYGWAWRPGPANQYWSPAVVHFTECNGNIAWCALSPAEIHYPAAISVGNLGEDWPSYFSIGAAGCYYPFGVEYCVGRAFSTVSINRSARAPQGTTQFEFASNTTVFSAGRPFVPANAKAAAGVTSATQAAFVGHGPYTPLIAGSTALFLQGHMAAAPPVGRTPVFGPLGLKPNVGALTSSRAYVTVHNDISSAASLPVFHSTVPKEPVQTGIVPARSSSGIAHFGGAVTGSPSSGSSSVGATSRSYTSGPEGAGAPRSTFGGGRTTSGSVSGGVVTPAGSPSAGSGYTAGHSPSGSSTAGGGTTGGSSAGRGPSGGSPGGGTTGGSSAGRSPSGGSTGGGTPTGGSSTGHNTPVGSGSSGGSGSGAGSSAGHTSGGSATGGAPAKR